MKKNKLNIKSYLLIFIISICLGLYLYIANCLKNRHLLKTGIESEIVVKTESLSTEQKPYKNYYFYTTEGKLIQITYHSNSKSFSGDERLSTSKVIYDENNPESFIIVPSDKCNNIITYLGVSLLIYAVLSVLIKVFKFVFPPSIPSLPKRRN